MTIFIPWIILSHREKRLLLRSWIRPAEEKALIRLQPLQRLVQRCILQAWWVLTEVRCWKQHRSLVWTAGSCRNETTQPGMRSFRWTKTDRTASSCLAVRTGCGRRNMSIAFWILLKKEMSWSYRMKSMESKIFWKRPMPEAFRSYWIHRRLKIAF